LQRCSKILPPGSAVAGVCAKLVDNDSKQAAANNPLPIMDHSERANVVFMGGQSI
jgi:hypothetical protein